MHETPTPRLAVRFCATALSLALAGLAGIAPARAATITVGSFSQFGGGCTLGNAILTAKNHAPVGGCVPEGTFGSDIVVLPTGTYTVTQQDSGNAFPVLTSDLTIAGNGATIDRPTSTVSAFRFFRVTGGHLKLLNLTLSGGRVTTGNGGAVLVSGGASLTLGRVTLLNNSVQSPPTAAKGGAIMISGGGALTAIGSAFVNNSVVSAGNAQVGGTAQGGAINVDTVAPVVVRLIDSAFQGNSAVAIGPSGGLSQGGALSFEGAGSVSITGCTLSQNSALSSASAGVGGSAVGGGVYVQYDDAGAGLDIAGTVLHQNTASASSTADADAGTEASGGGVYADLAGSALAIRDSRFWQNTATATSQARAGLTSGGGLFAMVRGAGAASIIRSAFVQNAVLDESGASASSRQAQARGGGIRFEGAAALQLSASTIANNVVNANSGTAGGSQADGAGVSVASSGALSAVNVTFAGNALSAVGGAGTGGALSVASPANIQNSLFSANAAPSAPNCSGSGASLGSNLFADGGACGSHPSDKVGVPAGLGSLTDLALPAGLVLPLSPGSAAIDGADAGACPLIDQIGNGRAGGCDIGALEFRDSVPLAPLVAAVLPASRAGVVGATLTAFVSVINAGPVHAQQVGIAQSAGATATLLTYQTTDPATNLPVGKPNTPADIPPGGIQTYVIALLITGPFDPADIELRYEGRNTAPVAPLPGLNTLLASGAVKPIADIVALAATAGNTGTVSLTKPAGGAFSSGAFAVATVGLGAGEQITVSPSAGSATPPVVLAACETDPATGACKSPPEPHPSVFIGAGTTPTFAVFVQSAGEIPFDPGANRIFLYFVDGAGAIRGGTSVAAQTTP